MKINIDKKTAKMMAKLAKKAEAKAFNDKLEATAKAFDAEVMATETAAAVKVNVENKEFVVKNTATLNNSIAMTTTSAVNVPELLSNDGDREVLLAVKRAARKALHAAKKAEAKAMAEAKTAARKERAAWRKFVAEAGVISMADNGELEIAIDAGPVKIAKAVKCRRKTVFGSEGCKVQAFQADFDRDGFSTLMPQVQLKAGSLMQRCGFLPPSPFQYGYSTVQSGGANGGDEVWLCRQDGLSDELLPIMITGNDEACNRFQMLLAAAQMPVLYYIDGFNKPRLCVFVNEAVVQHTEKDEKTGKINVKTEIKPGYVHFEQVCAQGITFVDGCNFFTVETVRKMMEQAKAKQELIASGNIGEPVRFYTTNLDSTSTGRKGFFVLLKTDNFAPEDFSYENREKFFEKRDRIINAMGGNVKQILDDLYVGKVIAADKLVKKIGRPSLLFTNSGKGAKPRAMMFTTSKFEFKGLAFADGFGFNSESLARRSFAENGFEDVTDVLGTGFQDRIITSKGYTLTISGRCMNAQIWNHIHQLAEKRGCSDIDIYKEIIRVDIDDPDEVAQIARDIEAGADYTKGKLVMIAPKGCTFEEIEYFADSNMLKAAFEFDKVAEISLMEMSHPAHGTYTSSQILESAIEVPGFHDTVMEIAKETIDRIFTLEASKFFTHKDFVNFDGFSDSVLPKLNPEFIFREEARAKNAAKTMAKAAKNAINNLRFKVEGGYMKALPDLGGFHFTQLLQTGEVYSPDLEKYAGMTIIIVRYPHTATSEFLMVKVVGIDELKNRIAKANIAFAFELWSIVSSIKKGQIMLPSLDGMTVAKLGGSDFDGDGVMAIVDQRIVGMYMHLSEGAVLFDPEPSGDMLPYNCFANETARLYKLSNGNSTTGVVVVLFYMFRSLKYDIGHGNIAQEKWSKLISNVFFPGDNKGPDIRDEHKKIVFTYKDKAFSIPTRNLFFGGESNPEAIQKACILQERAENGLEINNSHVKLFIMKIAANHISLENLENLEAVLKDLDPAGASVVGRIIDAEKNGEQVVVPLEVFSDFVQNGSRIDAEWDNEAFVLTISDHVGFSDEWEDIKKEDRVLNQYVTKNPLYYIKKELVAYTNGLLADFMEKAAKDSAPVGSAGGPCFGLAEGMARICTVLMGKQSKAEGLKNIAIPKAELSRYCTSMFRNATADMDYQSRYYLAKSGSAIYDEKTKVFNGYGRFYQTLGAESVLMAAEGKDIVVKTEIFAKKKGVIGIEGERIKMVDGQSDKYFAADRFTATGVLTFDAKGNAYIKSYLKDMADEAIASSIEENKVVFKIKRVPGLVTKDSTEEFKALVRMNTWALPQQVAALQKRTQAVFRFEANNAALGLKTYGDKVVEQDRLVAKTGAIACFVYNYCQKVNGKTDYSVSQRLHGKHIIIDHAIMMLVNNKSEALVFGRIID